MCCCGSCGSECVTGEFIVSKPTSNQQFHTHKQFYTSVGMRGSHKSDIPTADLCGGISDLLCAISPLPTCVRYPTCGDAGVSIARCTSIG
jgi:hypothetical protein